MFSDGALGTPQGALRSPIFSLYGSPALPAHDSSDAASSQPLLGGSYEIFPSSAGRASYSGAVMAGGRADQTPPPPPPPLWGPGGYGEFSPGLGVGLESGYPGSLPGAPPAGSPGLGPSPLGYARGPEQQPPQPSPPPASMLGGYGGSYGSGYGGPPPAQGAPPAPAPRPSQPLTLEELEARMLQAATAGHASSMPVAAPAGPGGYSAHVQQQQAPPPRPPPYSAPAPWGAQAPLQPPPGAYRGRPGAPLAPQAHYGGAPALPAQYGQLSPPRQQYGGLLPPQHAPYGAQPPPGAFAPQSLYGPPLHSQQPHHGVPGPQPPPGPYPVPPPGPPAGGPGGINLPFSGGMPGMGLGLPGPRLPQGQGAFAGGHPSIYPGMPPPPPGARGAAGQGDPGYGGVGSLPTAEWARQQLAAAHALRRQQEAVLGGAGPAGQRGPEGGHLMGPPRPPFHQACALFVHAGSRWASS